MQQQKFLKRPSDEVDSGPDSFEPPVKLQHNGENLTKFSVEIVQQLEFTTSAANSQPQQISTNVTVKALTNASVKSDGAQTQQQQQQHQTNQNNNQSTNSNHNATSSPSSHMHDLGHIVDFKQEPENDFADLEQCAAALEKDAAANGHFPGLSELIGDDTNDGNDTFKDLISDLSDFPLLDFDEKLVEIKQEDGGIKSDPSQNILDNLVVKGNVNNGGVVGGNNICGAPGNVGALGGGNIGSPMTQYSSSTFNDNSSMNNNKQRSAYNQNVGGNGNNNANANNNNPNSSMSELSPAAQTLKHMAEQHQHKNSMSMGFPRPPQPQNIINQQRSPYGDFNQFSNNNDYITNTSVGSAGVPNQFHKNSVPPFPNADLIKQEMMYASSQSDFDLKRLAQMPGNKIGPGGSSGGSYGNNNNNSKPNQQYSSYGSPGGGMANHGSPGPNYMPSRNTGGGGGGTGGIGGSNPNGAGGAPRPPPSSAGIGGIGNQGSTTLQMKQTQQLHISQQGGGHGIQVSFMT